MTGGSIVTEVTVLTEAAEPLHLLTVEDYHRMIQAGILTEEDKVELLDGALMAVVPEGAAHAEVASRLARWLIPSIDDPGLKVRIGSPVTFPPFSEPEPDLAVIDAADASFVAHPERAHLLIEVSHTSLLKDRDRKARIYAEAEIPRYWIVDLIHLTVIVHLDPSPNGYRSIRTYAPPEALDPDLFGIPPLDLEALFKHD
jgi:Uma2 family endonuclease